MKEEKRRRTQQYGAAVFWRLFYLYAGMLFGISHLNRFIRKKKNAVGKARISVVKILCFGLLFIYVGGCFVLLFATMMTNVYKALCPFGMQRFMFDLEILTLFFFLFASAFLLTLSTYFIRSIERTLRAMPIPPRIFFGAKFCAHCLMPIGFSLCFFGIAAVVYGGYEHPPPYFYAVILIGAVLFPLPIISLCYGVHILIMRSTRIFKNRQVLILVIGVVGLSLAVAVNVFVQSAVTVRQNPLVAVLLIEKQAVISMLAQCVLYGRFFADALTAGTVIEMIVAFVPFGILSLSAPLLLIVGFSGMYEKSLDGFDERKLNKITILEKQRFIRSTLFRRPVFTALLFREVCTMNREPVYLLNGPFMIVLLPIMFGSMYAVGSLRFPPEAVTVMRGNFGALFAGVWSAFLGSVTGVAATAVSRDAKNLCCIKSLPIPIKRYMQAKFVHAMIFSCIGSIIGIGSITVLFSLFWRDVLTAVMIAFSLTVFCNLLALMLDTVKPKLHWDSPAAAVKQNMNTLIMLFADTMLLGVTVVTAVIAAMPQWLYTLCFAGLPLIVSGISAHYFLPYAERKIRTLEV